jgi:SWI/SNF-related matrix-associated actin-dependent regulator of chromatin subfamily A3
MPPKKRSAEAIDLTDDLSIHSSQSYAHPSSSSQGHAYSSRSSPHARALKQPRTGGYNNITTGLSQQDPVVVDDDEDEEDGSQEAPDSSQGSND